MVFERLVEHAEGVVGGEAVVVGDEDVNGDAEEVVCCGDDLGFGVLVVGGEVGDGGDEGVGFFVAGREDFGVGVDLGGFGDGAESARVLLASVM